MGSWGAGRGGVELEQLLQFRVAGRGLCLTRGAEQDLWSAKVAAKARQGAFDQSAFPSPLLHTGVLMGERVRRQG